ncbi:hypothetical protein QAD02_021789 [Eretmocerus hayati]|uniref:Uncharacterized protein n=1 Tax=Eretmocerus hayati TaxID=131215 RepID=A0ACC2PSR7_9HYME|nr:hypothetical protein QAD02_021789 [Eretmocerus hayati]
MWLSSSLQGRSIITAYNQDRKNGILGDKCFPKQMLCKLIIWNEINLEGPDIITLRFIQLSKWLFEICVLYPTSLFNGHDCNGEPKFVKVRKIYRANDEVIFHGSDLRFIVFNERYHAYEVVDKSEPDTVLKYLDNAELLTCVYVTIDKRWYVATKYDL